MPTATDVRTFFSTLGRFFKTYWIASAIVLIFVFAVIGYLAGYRISTGFTLVRVGTLEIVGLPEDAQVFIDQSAHSISSTGTMDILLVPGTHTVIVAESGANPWENIATVSASAVTTIKPILFPIHPGVAPLSPADATAAYTAIALTRIPTSATPLVVGCVSLSVDKNRILASVARSTPGCTPPAYLCTDGMCEPTVVFSPIDTIKAVLAYPGHTDAILVAAGDKVFALGLDPRTPQAFAQFLSAPGIMIAQLPNGALVVRNMTGVYGLKL